MNSISTFEELTPLLEQTHIPCIKIETQPNSQLDIHSSKVGGLPYWPENKTLITFEGISPKLIAQINFSELTAQGITLKDFPQQGMLQFFVHPEDDMVGLEFDYDRDINHIPQSNIKVIYHEDITPAAIFTSELEEVSSDYEYMPFKKQLALHFSLDTDTLSPSDVYQASRLGINFDQLEDDILDQAYDELSNSGSKIYGYAYFTQEDPRGYRTHFQAEDDWILLLQLDTDDNLMWGDCGVANWFIKRQNLINRDFSKVFFTWDCC